MSTFMAAAWLDVVSDGDVEVVLTDLRGGVPADEPAQIMGWVGACDGGRRVELLSDDVGYGRLGDLVAGVLRRTAPVWRAVVFLDHDEYGAEHIVLARDSDGAVRRLHHVYVYPCDEDSGEYLLEGEPSMTNVPAAAGAGPGDGPGALIDDDAARAMTADLFGITPTAMQAAAARAATAREDLEITGAPSAAWLDAFGLAWIGDGGGAPINLRPGPIWRDDVARQVVPRLPGDWLARDYDLVRLPAAPVLCVILPSRWHGNAAIYPLYVPSSYGTLQFSVRLPTAVADPPTRVGRAAAQRVDR